MAGTGIVLATAEALVAFGEHLGARLRTGDVVTLSGGLGAGKTTLARGLLRGLGYQGDVPSPTFAILQGYEPPETRLPLGHVDLYRIDDPADVEELGLNDWLADGALVIEWPDRLAGRYDATALALQLDILDDGTRRLTARVPRGWEARWPAT